MSDDTSFRNAVENGDIIIDSHEKMVRIAFIYWYRAEGRGGLFEAVDNLHRRGWSFGQDELKFNR